MVSPGHSDEKSTFKAFLFWEIEGRERGTIGARRSAGGPLGKDRFLGPTPPPPFARRGVLKQKATKLKQTRLETVPLFFDFFPRKKGFLEFRFSAGGENKLCGKSASAAGEISKFTAGASDFFGVGRWEFFFLGGGDGRRWRRLAAAATPVAASHQFFILLPPLIISLATRFHFPHEENRKFSSYFDLCANYSSLT